MTKSTGNNKFPFQKGPPCALNFRARNKKPEIICNIVKKTAYEDSKEIKKANDMSCLGLQW